MLQTSAQDQFAKWAKLRRSMDKGLADLDKLSKSPIVFIICHFLPSRAAFVNVYSYDVDDRYPTSVLEDILCA